MKTNEHLVSMMTSDPCLVVLDSHEDGVGVAKVVTSLTPGERKTLSSLHRILYFTEFAWTVCFSPVPAATSPIANVTPQTHHTPMDTGDISISPTPTKRGII